MVDVINVNGTALRQSLKTQAHEHGWLHKTALGVLKYGNDWTLVRQAPDRQDAGQLVCPVGGHVQAGETELQALQREAEEEIGATNISHRFVGTIHFRRQVLARDENHLFYVYEIATEDPIVLSHEAVAAVRFTPSQLKRALRDSPTDFGDAFFVLLEYFYPDYLPRHYTFRWRTSESNK